MKSNNLTINMCFRTGGKKKGKDGEALSEQDEMDSTFGEADESNDGDMDRRDKRPKIKSNTPKKPKPNK